MKKRNFTIFLIIIFILSLIPLYYIAGYAHPSVDDYFYGAETAQIWHNTHSLGQVLQKSFVLMKDSYITWQGNFTAIFLMRLQPAIFGENYYVIAPIILITSFVISMLMFFYLFLKRCFHAATQTSIGTSIVITFTALQFTYMPSDSFYWYNGAIYYTFFFSLMLFLFSSLIVMATAKRNWTKPVYFLISLILAFIIGGGNYATALFTPIVLGVITVYAIYKHDKFSISYALTTLVAFISLIVSMIAPGNAIRQAGVEGGPSVIRAFVYSFAYGAYSIANSTTLPVLIIWIALLPVFYHIAAKYKTWEYKYPLLFLIFTFGIYCSQGTPVFYAQGLNIPYRMMNIIYFSYYGFVTINLIYFAGWIHRHFGTTDFADYLCNFYNSKYWFMKSMIFILLFSVSCVGLVTITRTDDDRTLVANLPLSVDATYAILNGSASIYDQELTERDKLLSSSQEVDIIVPELSTTPSPLFHTDITEDPTNWKNAHLSVYYNKHYISTSKQE